MNSSFKMTSIILRWGACIVLIGFAAIASALDNFTMSLSPAPVPGQSFNITWNPDTPGKVSVLLNTFTPAASNFSYSTELAVISDAGSYIWEVPTGLCGSYSFSIGSTDMTDIYSESQKWSIPCPSASAPVTQTTACISSISTPTGANPFLVPNAGNFPVRVGKDTTLVWEPTTSGTVSIQTYSYVSNTTTTIADRISNSGTFAWSPSSDLSSSSNVSTSGAGYVLQIIDDANQMITSTSPNIYLLSPSYNSVFFNTSAWVDPVIDSSVTFQWSPSNATTITIQIAHGPQPDFNQGIYVGTNVPNNGSFTWTVPANFTQGQYSVLIFTPGHLIDDLHAIFISSTTPSSCSPSVHSAAPSSSGAQVTGSTTTTSPPTASASSESSLNLNSHSSATAISIFLILWHIFRFVL